MVHATCGSVEGAYSCSFFRTQLTEHPISNVVDHGTEGKGAVEGHTPATECSEIVSAHCTLDRANHMAPPHAIGPESEILSCSSR